METPEVIHLFNSSDSELGLDDEELPLGVLNYHPNPPPLANNMPYDFGPNPYSPAISHEIRSLMESSRSRKSSRLHLNSI
ncbi:hypothetical protein M413DRAFT_21269 [Hebeloma cylindrosporum]|uniref:Uncharacterized protein n=1 Tax=Hebeloma cylindrosporum TaxID=76867 RepID=A0A0C2YGZ2_HEBCY|nr:hypothetical protein M413DRAFT_21269 [Hebeloma cylindrosporum h7]